MYRAAYEQFSAYGRNREEAIAALLKGVEKWCKEGDWAVSLTEIDEDCTVTEIWVGACYKNDERI